MKKHIIKGKVMASSLTLAGLSDIIIKSLYWSRVDFIPCEGGWSVSNAKGNIERYRVRNKNGRFQLIDITL